MLPCRRPASSATRSRALPSSSRQHRSRLRRLNTSCAGGNLLLPPRLQSLSLLVAVGAPLRPPPLPRSRSSLPPGSVVEPVADRTPSPSRPPPNLAVSAGARGPETGDPEMEETAQWEMVTAPLPPPEEGRVENLLFRFVSVPPLAQQPAVPKTSIKEQFLNLWVSRGGEWWTVHHEFTSLFLSRQAAGGCPRAPSCPFVEPGKGGSTPVPASSRHTPGCHKPQAGFLCFLPHEEESGECYTTHPDPAPCHHRPGRHRPRGGSLCSTMLPLRGYVGGPLVPLARSLGAWLALPRSVSVAPADHQTRLRDSVRPASPQVQGCPLHFSESCRCPCPVCGNRSPAGEGCDRNRSLQPIWGRGFTTLTSLCPRKAVGYDRSWICEFWTVHFTSCRSECWRRNAFSGASVP